MRNVVLSVAAPIVLSLSVLTGCAGESSDDTTAMTGSSSATGTNGTKSTESASVTTSTGANGSASGGGATGNGSATGTGNGASNGSNGNGDTAAPSEGTGEAPAATETVPAKPATVGTCSFSDAGNGFQTRSNGNANYVVYVPQSYSGDEPVQLVVGMHGCGDNAYNYATWGVNPYDTRSTQKHIGISVGGADGRCWGKAEADKVLAAMDDAMSCFYVHPKRVIVSGFSSGGELAYRVGFDHAEKFAGILIEDASIYAAVDDASPDENALIQNAAWKINIAHRTHSEDSVFPLAGVQADWVKLQTAGFPIQTSITGGGHDGQSADWAGFLLPAAANWQAP